MKSNSPPPRREFLNTGGAAPTNGVAAATLSSPHCTAAGPATGLVLPAALGFAGRSRSIVGLDLFGGKLGGGLFAWQPGRLMLGYRHLGARALGHNEDHYFAALSRASGRRAWGLELALLRNDVAGAADAFTIGLSAASRPSPRLSLATRVDHLNRPHFLRGRLERTVTAGIGYRPWGPRVTLAADLFYRSAGGDRFLGRYGFEINPATGLHLAASLDDAGGCRIAVAAHHRTHELGWGYDEDADLRQRQFVHLGYESGAAPRRARLAFPLHHADPGSR